MSELTLERKVLKDNDEMVNQYMAYILEAILLIGPFLAMGRRMEIINASYMYCMVIFAFSIVIYMAYKLMIYVNCKHRIPKYFGLISMEILVGIVASKTSSVIYISYALVVVLSCMYYDHKLTKNISFFGYLIMVGTLFAKHFDYKNGILLKNISMKEFEAVLIGFSMEYIIISIVACLVAKKARITLRKEHDNSEKIKVMQKKLITGFANLVESRDEDTGMHIKNTSEYVRIIAEKLRDNGHYLDTLSDENIKIYTMAAPLHDMGKLRIPDAILCKPGRLTDEEFEIVKIHPQEGEKIINMNMSEIEDENYLETARMMALYHHEKWDGSGYPTNLKGEDIPLCARIMAAADVLDALLSNRAYKKSFTIQKTMSIFKESKGTHFEPCIAEAVLMLKDEIQLISMANNIQ